MNSEIIQILEKSNEFVGQCLLNKKKFDSKKYLASLHLYSLLTIEDSNFFIQNLKKYTKNTYSSLGVLVSSLPVAYYLNSKLNIPYKNSILILSPFFLLLPIYMIYKNYQIEGDLKNLSLGYFQKVSLFFATGNVFDLNKDFLKLKSNCPEIEEFKQKIIKHSEN